MELGVNSRFLFGLAMGTRIKIRRVGRTWVVTRKELERLRKDHVRVLLADTIFSL